MEQPLQLVMFVNKYTSTTTTATAPFHSRYSENKTAEKAPFAYEVLGTKSNLSLTLIRTKFVFVFEICIIYIGIIAIR